MLNKLTLNSSVSVCSAKMIDMRKNVRRKCVIVKDLIKEKKMMVLDSRF